MNNDDWLARRFEENRPHLRAVAYRMLGSASEADDAVQESWFRLSRTDTSDVQNLRGWLTTVVSRVSLDMLRSRTSRREEPLDTDSVEPAAGGPDPEREAILADSVGPALLVVLDSLAPAERLAFVLHDMFAVPFDEIAAILGRSPAATRQLASRARRRVQGAEVPNADAARQRQIVDAFLAASRNGEFEALLSLLDPDVVLTADEAAIETASKAPTGPWLAPVVRGAGAVAEMFSGRARAAQAAIIDGVPGMAWAPGGRTRAVLKLTFTADGAISAIEILRDPETVAGLEVTLLDA
ncbi:sigma-70 family RNA polymerase sigma factor [Jiangella asiatica]|uniref:Sigma-70 family RNA polymerase sigma factor n=1 Tax=Jiangella asiatica TaxID=2530372 RepID=A0A4V2Z3H2_9ACTN|nr:sigma-70 family RNA polymerase sigma factor [Jiangella asiatica]TDE12648.1 sigma-70 family RNA polymerase sigma factor [Jiangella asiatica]